MDIDDAVGIPRHKARREYPHVTGQDDVFRRVAVDHPGQLCLVRLPRQVAARSIVMGQMMKGQAEPLDKPAEAVVVADHRHDPPRQVAHGVEQQEFTEAVRLAGGADHDRPPLRPGHPHTGRRREHVDEFRRQDTSRREHRRTAGRRHLRAKEKMPRVGVDELVVALDVETMRPEHTGDPMDQTDVVGAVNEHDLPSRSGCSHHHALLAACRC